MATNSCDSDATSFSSEFLTLWRGLIVRLSFTYACIVTQPKVLAEILIMLHSGEPSNLPPNHPFLVDFKEFLLFFDHVRHAFPKNKTQISTFLSLEADYRNKKDQVNHAKDVLEGQRKMQELAHKMLSKFSQSKERMVEKLVAIEERLGRAQMTRDWFNHKAEREGIKRVLFDMDRDIQGTVDLVKCIDDVVDNQLAVLVGFEKECDDLHTVMETQSVAYHRALEGNRRLESRLSSFVVKFIKHIRP